MCKRYAFIKEESMKELFEGVESRIRGGSNLVLIAGASASGKSYMAESLKKYLERSGLRVAQFSSDMYYKGISRIITEKTFLHNVEFMSYINSCSEIANGIRDIICEYEFPEKFCDENFDRINSYLKSVMPEFVADRFSEKLRGEFERINFDEPFCIDFDKLSHDINTISSGGTIYVPKYSFRTGESELDMNNAVSRSRYDVVIVEGLYTLRDELLNNIRLDNIVSIGINCDAKTLLSRRLNRDINSDRCSFTPEQVIMSFLSQVMPAFYAYIYPTLPRADIIYNTTLTNNEINSSEKSIQIKYVTGADFASRLKASGARLISKVNQRDYFLEDRSATGSGITLRIREENGLATKLSIKVKTTRLERAIQEYNLKDIMSRENRDISKLLEHFKASGYETLQVVNKTRRVYNLGNNIIKVDDVKNLGTYVEIDEGSLSRVADIRKVLSLGEPTATSYYDLYIGNLSNLSHTECEKKFVVKGLDREVISRIFREYDINQYYLDTNQPKVVEKIDKTLNSQFNLSDISEARVRVIDGKEAYLTLKSSGNKTRREIEKEIPITLAHELISTAKSVVSKGRYEISERDGMKVEVDFYNNSPLCIMEIEYDENNHTDVEVIEFASNIFGDNVSIVDVTDDRTYKNVNLATELNVDAN